MRSLFLILFFLIKLKAFSQENRIENIYQSCVYNSLPDKGVLLKKCTKEFEAYLISENLLKDSTKTSYKELLLFLKKPSNVNNLRVFKYSYIDSLHSYGTNIKGLFLEKECIKEIVLHDSFEDFMTKTEKFSPELLNNIDNFFVTIDSILSEKDFELPYYKQRFLAIFSLYNELFSLDSE